MRIAQRSLAKVAFHSNHMFYFGQFYRAADTTRPMPEQFEPVAQLCAYLVSDPLLSV